MSDWHKVVCVHASGGAKIKAVELCRISTQQGKKNK